MKISYNWLKQYIDLNLSPEETAARLTASGLEVESVEPFEQVKGSLEGLVIGEVLTCQKHPDADKLSVTTVDTGQGEPKQIVCGAPNVAAGQKVVVATEGAMLYPAGGESFKIKKSKIRGAASEGMICAEDEIGIGTSHAGIMVLDTELPNGTPAARFFNLEADSVLEIGLTPNRADAASHYGVARDLAVLLRQPAHLPDISAFREAQGQRPVQIEVKNPEACLRYAGISIEGVQVQESPEWLKLKLKAIGLSPLNNVVDITNFVLHELGQPLHAFDAGKIAGNRIVVKTAEGGETFTTLDGIERKLQPGNLLICNAEEPMVIAGIFGGLNAAVSQGTTRIFLESACFSPDSVRRTSQQLGIKTDSSFRFERGTDPNMVIPALMRAALLIVELAGGHISSEIADVYPEPVPHHKVAISPARIDRLIGERLDRAVMQEILERLEIRIEEQSEEQWVLAVPPYRVDVRREADIAEELLRIYGYNAIPLKPHMSTRFIASFPKPDPEQVINRIADSLSAVGYNQIVTNSLTNSEFYRELPAFPEEERVAILNYNSEELNVMRQTMLFSGLEVVRHNLNRRQRDLKLYEFGTTYHGTTDGYRERSWLALFLTGNNEAESWQAGSRKAGFHDLMAGLHRVLTLLGIEGKVARKAIETGEVLAGGLELELNGKPLGRIGQVQPALARRLELKETVYYAELDWTLATRKLSTKATIEEISKFPEVRRDLSLVLDKSVTFDQIKALAAKAERKLLQQINLFDVYEGDKIGQGQKAYSVSFVLQDKTQTLTDKIIDGVMEKLMKSYEQELGAVIRK